jgi:ATP-dependent RNA helicase DHX57
MTVLSEHRAPEVLRQLSQLGFTPAQARNAVQLLSKPSSLTSTLLNTSSPLEAAIEYLVLHVPECDLPERFLPAANSSNPFVTSAHSGTDDLRKRWLLEKAFKEAGFPTRAVISCTADERLLVDWEHLIACLGRKLIGEGWDDLFAENLEPEPVQYRIDADEVEALGAHYETPTHLTMPLFSAPIKLNILLSPNGPSQITGQPPIYVTSSSVPAYIRLHLLAQLLKAMQTEEFMQSEEGFCMASMGLLEGEWAKIEDNGPPDISTVFNHLLSQPSSLDFADAGNSEITAKATGPKSIRKGRRDDLSDIQVKDAFQKLCQTEKYVEMLNTRTRLPAFKAREEFLGMLEKSRVVVVVGETGCGKTTQLPQFILDSLILSNRGSGANIVITQPRRISAISVAARVSAERLEDGSVGYAIRGESKQDKRTKLLFCTTGVVLRRLGSGDNLENVTHVVVDEVHERSLDGDFLLLELKELLIRQPHLKVVLMSATINHETFIKYFNGAPLLEIPGFTHPVTDIYLENVVPMIDYRPPTARSTRKESEAQKKASHEAYQALGLSEQSINAIENIIRSDRIDYQLIAAVVQHIIKTAEKRGGVLIFLPGVQEIRQSMDAIRGALSTDQAEILPLHANLSNDEQRRVFANTKKWKIIAATNVAEVRCTETWMRIYSLKWPDFNHHRRCHIRC